MANQDLINFINESRAKGLDDKATYAELIKVGWAEKDVNEAFGSLIGPSDKAPQGPARENLPSSRRFPINKVLLTGLLTAGIFFLIYVLSMWFFPPFIFIFGLLFSAGEIFGIKATPYGGPYGVIPYFLIAAASHFLLGVVYQSVVFFLSGSRKVSEPALSVGISRWNKSKKYLMAVAIWMALGLVLSVVISIRGAYKEADRFYAEKLYEYSTAKLCYECATGMRGGTCPKIDRDPSLAGYIGGINAQYPMAKEYSGSVSPIYNARWGAKAEEINDVFIVEHYYCYYRDWTDQNEYISGYYKEPKKETIIAAELEKLKKKDSLWEIAKRAPYAPVIILFVR